MFFKLEQGSTSNVPCYILSVYCYKFLKYRLIQYIYNLSIVIIFSEWIFTVSSPMTSWLTFYRTALLPSGIYNLKGASCLSIIYNNKLKNSISWGSLRTSLFFRVRKHLDMGLICSFCGSGLIEELTSFLYLNRYIKLVQPCSIVCIFDFLILL